MSQDTTRYSTYNSSPKFSSSYSKYYGTTTQLCGTPVQTQVARLRRNDRRSIILLYMNGIVDRFFVLFSLRSLDPFACYMFSSQRLHLHPN